MQLTNEEKLEEKLKKQIELNLGLKGFHQIKKVVKFVEASQAASLQNQCP